MVDWEKVEIVQKIQDYIKDHLKDESINFKELYFLVAYSERHANRVFKELTGKTILEYIREIKLTESTESLSIKEKSILNIALDTNFKSHEGYTRAFSKKFGVTPNKYREEKMPISLFVQHPIKHYYSHILNKEISNMDKGKDPMLCMITVQRKPKRKLIFMRAEKAHDYWSFCEEKGCEWEGLFNSIECKLDQIAILELPKHLVKEGTTNCAAGIEVPIDYNGAIPSECDCIELDSCEMMYFQSEPFDNIDDYEVAISYVFKALEKYDPNRYGYKFNPELAPKFNYGASTEMGAKIALPVQKI